MASATTKPIRMCTINVHGFKNSWTFLLTLLESHDLVFVQELWLHDHEMHLLHSLSKEFVVYTRSGMANAVQNRIIRGRPFGGIAVFIRRTLSSLVTFCTCDDDARVICVKYVSENVKLLLFGCYFPFNDHSADYANRVADVLGFIENVCNDYHGFNMCILGDCNFECAMTNIGYSVFADFSDRCNLISCDDLSTRENAYTYHHETLGQRSYLDHVFISRTLKEYVCDYEIIDSAINTSDHLPVSFCLMIPCDAYQDKVHSKNSNIVRDYR